ncbi:MAG TPA: hypothetical protein VIY48_07095 [Candidatus Paceibacterota bacterium]
MTASYTPVTVSGYNAATAPVDDGTVTATNKISWSIIKTKLSDPVDTAFTSINTNVGTAVTTLAANLATAQANLTASQATYSALTGTMYAPSTTGMFFVNTSAPTGWTKGTTYNDYALRLISADLAGVAAGTTAFTTILASRTIAQANMPNDHNHTFSASANISFSNSTHLSSANLSSQNDVKAGSDNQVDSLSTSSDTVAGSGSISVSSSSSGSGTALAFDVKYVDIIYATKD